MIKMESNTSCNRKFLIKHSNDSIINNEKDDNITSSPGYGQEDHANCANDERNAATFSDDTVFGD